MYKKFITNLVVFMMLFSFVSVDAQEVNDVLVEEDFDAGWVHPGSFWGFMENDWFDSHEEAMAEHAAEYVMMHEQGDYEAAEHAFEDYRSSIEEYVEVVDGSDDIGFVVEAEKNAFQLDDYFEDHVEVIITEEEFEDGVLVGAYVYPGEIFSEVDDSKKEFIEEYALQQGIPELQVDLELVSPLEEDLGVTEEYIEEVEELLPEASAKYLELKTDYDDLIEEEEFVGVWECGTMMDWAETDLLNIITESEDLGRPDEAFELLNDLIDDLGEVESVLDLEEEIIEATEEEREALVEVIEAEIDAVLEEEEIEDDEYQEELITYIDNYDSLLASQGSGYFDDYDEDLDGFYEISSGILDFQAKFAEEYEVEFDELLDLGMTEEEAEAMMWTREAEFQEQFFGGAGYLPPGVPRDAIPEPPWMHYASSVSPLDEGIAGSPIEGFDFDFHYEAYYEDDHGGGFLFDYEYEDPFFGNDYEFESDGYSYVDPYTGEEFSVTWDDDWGIGDFDHFDDGDDIFEFDYFGGYEVHYGATGAGYFETGFDEVGNRVLVDPSDSVFDYSYEPGDWDVVGGGDIIIDDFFFSWEFGGDEETWDYDPAFDSYIDPDSGEAFSFGFDSYHEDAFEWNDDGFYEYADNEGHNYEYYSDVGAWYDEDGESHYDPAGASHPPDYWEDEGSYTDPSGAEWEFTDDGFWESVDGGYSIDPDSGHYYDGEGVAYEGEWNDDIGGYDYFGEEGDQYYADPNAGGFYEAADSYDHDTGEYEGGGFDGYVGDAGDYSAPGEGPGDDFSGSDPTGDGGGDWGGDSGGDDSGGGDWGGGGFDDGGGGDSGGGGDGGGGGYDDGGGGDSGGGGDGGGGGGEGFVVKGLYDSGGDYGGTWALLFVMIAVLMVFAFDRRESFGRKLKHRRHRRR